MIFYARILSGSFSNQTMNCQTAVVVGSNHAAVT